MFDTNGIERRQVYAKPERAPVFVVRVSTLHSKTMGIRGPYLQYTTQNVKSLFPDNISHELCSRQKLYNVTNEFRTCITYQLCEITLNPTAISSIFWYARISPQRNDKICTFKSFEHRQSEQDSNFLCLRLEISVDQL